VLIHPWDVATRAEWQEVLAVHDFGQFVTAGHVDGFPVIVPTHFLYDGEATVHLHLARPNPVWEALEQTPAAVLTVAADWAYVEAAWNTDGDPSLGVPTSYYTSVQLLGTARIVDDPAEKLGILAAQLAHMEPIGSARVSPLAGSESDRRQLAGIRGIAFRIEAVRAKQKYGGNKPPEQRHAIADRLAERDSPGDAVARQHLLRRTEG
jgi:transcriptional regulator